MLKWLEALKKRYKKRYLARTIWHVSALFIVSSIFVGLTVNGTLRHPPTYGPTSDYADLTKTSSVELEQLLRTQIQAQTRIKARAAGDLSGAPIPGADAFNSTAIKGLTFFFDIKSVAVMATGLQNECLVESADVDEMRKLAAEAQIPVQTLKPALRHLDLFSSVAIGFWILLLPLLAWWGYFLFMKRDGGQMPNRIVSGAEVISKTTIQLQKRSHWTKQRFYLTSWLSLLAVLTFASLFGLFNATALVEVPKEYEKVTVIHGWQAERFLDAAPKRFERAAVIEELNSVYFVVGPVDSLADMSESKPLDRVAKFNNKQEVTDFQKKLVDAQIPTKKVKPYLNSNWGDTISTFGFLLFLAMWGGLFALGGCIANYWSSWSHESAPTGADGKAGVGGGARIVTNEGEVMYADEDSRKMLDDVAGCDEAVEQFREVASWLRNGRFYKAFKAKLPRGILLSGPPGTGKTLLARALAGEVDGNFFTVSASEFVEIWVGQGAKRVRAKFKQAKDAARRTGKPSILFIDEIDAVGKKRSDSGSGGDQERDQTVNQLLTCMQGFDPENGTLVIAATNRPETLDDGLTRSGRFDLKISVGRPDRKGRARIFAAYLKDRQLEEGLELLTLCDDLSKRSPDFVGADIELVVNKAATIAAKRAAIEHGLEFKENDLNKLPKILTANDLRQGIDKVKFGERLKSKVRTEEDRRTTAAHEVGHAVIPTVKKGDPVTSITIAMTDKTLGMMESSPEEDRYGWTNVQFMTLITTMLAGRAAEEMIGKSVSTGASNDFERASAIARAMVGKYGMSPMLGPISLPLDQHGFPVSKIGAELETRFSQEWQRIIAECDKEARDIVEEHRARIIYVSNVLYEEEMMTGDRFRELWEGDMPVGQDAAPATVAGIAAPQA